MRGGWWRERLVVGVAVALAASPDVRADETEAGDRPAQASAGNGAPPARKRELGFVPLAGGDTDVGFGIGQLTSYVQLDPARAPYAWSLESGGFVTFRSPTQGGGVESPYQDLYVLFIAPQLWDKRLRFEARAAYTREAAQKYYGMGNASFAPTDTVPERDFYERTHPTSLVRARLRLVGAWRVEVAASYTQNWLRVDPRSTLAEQAAGGDARTLALIGDTAPWSSHGVAFTDLAVLWDSRDSEVAPSRGMFHEIRVRGSPSVGDTLPYGYAQLGAIARGYHTLIPSRLVLAGRVVFDWLFGNPPFYELARYTEDTFAIGGSRGVRGVPGQRYYGKVKLFANTELRAEVYRFTIRGKPFGLGLVGFVDTGRLWSAWPSDPLLDGQGLGLKWGLGGGLRLVQGQTFVVRADVAWSPDARPVGGYVGAGHLF